VVAANVSLQAPRGATVVEVGTAAELLDVCGQNFDECDVLLMAAAVADFRPSAPAAAKLKKDQGVPLLELESTADVLSALAERRRPGQVLVGFAAEHGDGAIEYARGKLERKRLDAVVLNDISATGIGFDAPDNEVTIITGGAERHVPRARKDRIARAVLDEVERLRATEPKESGGTPAQTGATTRADTRSATRV
jgi:phosphopantothenoylcysteine decarboxylase/phosphopantothenate--cysteine ligase